MNSHALLLVLSLSLVGGAASPVDCACPAAATGTTVMRTGRLDSLRFVVCGFEEGQHVGDRRASEFGVYRCSDQKKVLAFDATQTAELVAEGDDLRVTEVRKWPIGPKGEWRYMPIARLVLQARHPETQVWHPLLERLSVPSRRVTRIVAEYRYALRANGTRYSPDETVVGNLFVASLARSAEARRLFCGMAKQVHLDGAAAEAYDSAVQDLLKGSTAHVPADAEREVRCKAAFRSI